MKDPTMLEIHIRISRKLLLWAVGVFLALSALTFVLMYAGGGHSSVQPPRTVQGP